MSVSLVGTKVPVSIAQRRVAPACRPLRHGIMTISVQPSVQPFTSTCKPRLAARGVQARATQDERPVKYNTEFGYSRKDVILIGVGLIALGYALYYGLQATGMEAGMAGKLSCVSHGTWLHVVALHLCIMVPCGYQA